MPVPPRAAAPDEAPDWSYTVSVRSLCEFSARRGDLDRRFTPSATALEGLQGQAAVAARRGPAYERELALATTWGPLRVRGRADGHDPLAGRLEEVKTLRGPPEAVPANRRALHWAQLHTYGAIYCRERGLARVELALVYVDALTQTETVERETAEAAVLEAAFVARCQAFAGWAEQEARHRAARDAALAALAFPPGAWRAGQRTLAEAVYRAAAAGRTLLAQAPTGIGKTLGTLYPLLRAMPGQQLDKLAYLTCKNTTRLGALDALQALRADHADHADHAHHADHADHADRPGALRVLALVAREQACEHPDKACHGASCPLARGFHDRLPAARAAAVAAGWLDAAAQRRIARDHGLCPYYLGQELLRWADVLVGDVHHLFDPRGQLWGLGQALGWRLGVLVDEAHNLVERARGLYSAELSLADGRAVRALAPPGLRGRLDAWLRAAQALADEHLPSATAPAEAYAALDAVPAHFDDALQALAAALAEHFQDQPEATGPLLAWHFAVQRFVQRLDALGEHSLFDLQRRGAPAGAAADRVARADLAGAGADAATEPPADLFGTLPPPPPAGDTVLSVRNLVPAGFLRPRWAALHTATLFSATLGPPDYPRRLLGLPDDCAWLDVPPAFPAEHLQVRVAAGLSTRFADRRRSLPALCRLLARQFDAHPGNYLAFFPSFDYLDTAAQALAAARPDIPQWRQDRRMDADARQAFLARFRPGGRGIGFAVLGGVFAEGVDLPGSRLVGAFVATLGLPPVGPLQDQVRARMDTLFGADSGYADLVPAMQRVVQAAGRVLRTPEDRGWLWLLDGRYRRPEVRRLLPPAWGLGGAGAAGTAPP